MSKSMAALLGDGWKTTYKVGWIPLRLGKWVVAHDLAGVYHINRGTHVERI